MHYSQRQIPTAGFTLLELMTYTGLIGVIGLPLLSVVMVSTRSTSENFTINHVTERNRVAIYRVTREIRKAVSDTVAIGGGGTQLTFTLPNGFDGFNVIPGDTIRYALNIVPDESPNSADDNGNGLIDEGQLERTNLSTGESFVVCQGLDLANCSFSLNGTAVRSTFASQGFIPQSESVYSLTKSLTVTPRN